MAKQTLWLVLVVVLVFPGCAIDNQPGAILPDTPIPPKSDSLNLEQTAEKVLQLLAARDFSKLAEYVHPMMGVRFSPYAYVKVEHQQFQPEELEGLSDSDVIYNWGNYDGSGKPIELTFADYYDEFVYSRDFLNADQVAVNQRIGEGNTISNIEEFYPSASFVEYHVESEDNATEMDWQSLRLVFIEEDGVWLLVGIVHDAWTI